MSGGGGGRIILNRIAPGADLDSVKEQLGSRKRAKLEALLQAGDETWTKAEGRFVLKCLLDAYDDYE